MAYKVDPQLVVNKGLPLDVGSESRSSCPWMQWNLLSERWLASDARRAGSYDAKRYESQTHFKIREYL